MKGKKTGGRKQGSCNKVTKDTRAFIGKLLDSQGDTLFDDFAAVEPHQRLAMFERLLPYVCPKKREQDDRQLSPIEEFFQHRLEQVKHPVSSYDDSDDDGSDADDADDDG
ncbi:MAG: hypothetical protein LBR50_11700 [Tannerella sp.]|jgi:hypothetical protein|nr:hypothetical protein [Tannerella sp.]